MTNTPTQAEDDTTKALLIFENPDKKGTRPSGDDPAMPRWPFRLLLAGPPGVGKRNMLLNLLFRLNPPPSAVHIVHYDPDTPEYQVVEELGVPMYYYSAEDFPTAENLENPDPVPVGDTANDDLEDAEPLDDGEAGKCPLVIIDEITEEQLGKDGKARLERLMNYGSTHKNTSVCYSIQAVTNVPPKARRAFNQFCLWPQPDEGATNMAATRAGVPPAMLKELFGLCTDRHDSIWVDCDQPPDSPLRFRLNFLTPITAEEAVNAADYA